MQTHLRRTCYITCMLQGAAFRILACFYDNNELNFVELCNNAGYPTDLGGYYIRQLVRGGYLEKIDRGQYRILPEGKRQLAFHYGKKLFADRPRLAVLLVAQQDQAFVVLRRKVQPFIGKAEWPAGMVNAGETLQAAAKRIAESRLGVDVDPNQVGFFRRIDMYHDAVFDDKLFAVHACTIADNLAINASSKSGDNILCRKADLFNLPNASKALTNIFNFSQDPGSGFEERTYNLGQEDLDLAA